MSCRSRGQGGFTIMEVMVAVLILAVSIVSIFGAQFAAIATVDYARFTTHATQLARCKMNEIELEFLTEGGFEVDDVLDSGDCCEFLDSEDDVADFQCNWEIKSIEMPDITEMLSGGADGGLLDDFDLGETTGMDDEMGEGMMAAFGPMISEMLKQAIRRVTVTVSWEQGSKKREYRLSQYVVHPTQGPLELMHEASSVDEMIEEQEVLREESSSLRGREPR